MKRCVVLLVLFAGFLILPESLFAQGCSQCKIVAEQSIELDEGAFASNINIGILLLMATPYIIVFAVFRKRLFLFFKDFFFASNQSPK